MEHDARMIHSRGLRRHRFALLLLAILVIWPLRVSLAPASASSASRLTPQERRGKRIYLSGRSASGQEIKALLGEETLELPATLMPCANCHGADGRGRPEGGLDPGDITWESLTKPYGHTHASGRTHPAYTDGLLGRAILDGYDPAHNRLLAAMPRYRLSRDDLADLISYLKRLDADQDPGLTDDCIKVGTILPSKGNLAELGQAIKRVLAAYFDEINEQGGLYHRRLELQVLDVPESRAMTTAHVKRQLQEQEIFALVGALIAGDEKELAALVENEEVPLIGPFALDPQIGFPLNRQVFYLFSGLKDQARALVDFAAPKIQAANHRPAIVYPENGIAPGAVEAVERQCQQSGWTPPAKVSYQPGRLEAEKLVLRLSQEETEMVFFFGSGAEQLTFTQEAERRRWAPQLFLLGSLTGKEALDAPLSFTNKIFLAYPSLPSDQTRAGAMEYRALLEKRQLPAQHLATQISALSAAKILVEGLKLAGKDLSREKLIAALEGLYEFDTGLTPRVTYGPNRRIGALGAYVVTLDVEKKRFIPVSAWITPR
jgi:ABC-type branched-subunit amino acid transport system substrate-binding protein